MRCGVASTPSIAWNAASRLDSSTCPRVALNSCSPLTSSSGPTTLTLSELDPALTTRTRILVRPLPVRDVGRVFAVVARVLAVLPALAHPVPAHVRPLPAQPRPALTQVPPEVDAG